MRPVHVAWMLVCCACAPDTDKESTGAGGGVPEGEQVLVVSGDNPLPLLAVALGRLADGWAQEVSTNGSAGVQLSVPYLRQPLAYLPEDRVALFLEDDGAGASARVVARDLRDGAVLEGDVLTAWDAAAGTLNRSFSVTLPARPEAVRGLLAVSPTLAFITRTELAGAAVLRVDLEQHTVTLAAAWTDRQGTGALVPHLSSGTLVVQRHQEDGPWLERWSAEGTLRDARPGLARCLGGEARVRAPDTPVRVRDEQGALHLSVGLRHVTGVVVKRVPVAPSATPRPGPSRWMRSSPRPA